MTLSRMRKQTKVTVSGCAHRFLIAIYGLIIRNSENKHKNDPLLGA